MRESVDFYEGQAGRIVGFMSQSVNDSVWDIALLAVGKNVARMGEKRNVYGLLVGKPEGKRPLGRSRRRWIDNIKMDLLEIGVNVVDWWSGSG
jgi:hypothetical protein